MGQNACFWTHIGVRQQLPLACGLPPAMKIASYFQEGIKSLPETQLP